MKVGVLLWKLSVRNVWRHKRRSILTMTAIALGVWSCATLSSLARGLSAGMAEDAIRNFTGHIQVQTEQYVSDPAIEHAFLDTSIAPELFQMAQIVTTARRLKVPAVVMSERESFPTTLVAVNPDQELGVSFVPHSLEEGAYFKSASETGIIVGAALLERLQTALGKRIVLLSQGLDGRLAERGFRITGVFRAELEATELGVVVVTLPIAQEFLKAPGAITEVSVLLEPRVPVEQVQSELHALLPEMSVKTWGDLHPFISSLIRLQAAFIDFLFFLVFCAVSFGVVNTLLMSVLERTRELGLIQALGMRPPHIVGQVSLESVVLVLCGAIGGNIMGALTLALLSISGVDISAFAEGAAHVGVQTLIFPLFLLRDWIVINIAVFVVALVSCVYPCVKATTLTPVAAMRQT